MVVWEHGFSQQDNGISLAAVLGKCCYKMHQLRLLVDVSRPNPNVFQIFPACPESVFRRFKWRFLLGCQFWGWLLCILMGICITRSWCLVFHNVFLCWIGWMATVFRGEMMSSSWFSSQDALEKVWDLVVPGGIIVIDDFFHKVQGPARPLSAQPGLWCIFSTLFSILMVIHFQLGQFDVEQSSCGLHYAPST